jgi:hypothetical protein
MELEIRAPDTSSTAPPTKCSTLQRNVSTLWPQPASYPWVPLFEIEGALSLYHSPLTIISLCSSRFFKKLENSRKEASAKRKEWVCGGRGRGAQTSTSAHIPMQRSSSVSASPINSNLKSLSEWANFRWAAERPRKKGTLVTWVIFKSRLGRTSFLLRWVELESSLRPNCEKAQPCSCHPQPGTLWVTSVLYTGRTGAQELFIPSPTTSSPGPTISPRSLKHFPFSLSTRTELAWFKSLDYG